ncbi:hypothetical protein BDV59DRAFT_19268 [Aspergillus ambiguus]|uniref:uncharacterized protein n=1 Tax=Aspergillus ambiguus TaxID=176160 RepID=UPI003CCD4CA5
MIAITKVLATSPFTPYSYHSSFYASKPAHVYVVVDRHDPVEPGFETINHPLPKHATTQTVSTWDEATILPGLSERLPSRAWPCCTSSPSRSGWSVTSNARNGTSHTLGLAQSVCDWIVKEEWPAGSDDGNAKDGWVCAPEDDAASFADTEPYEEGFFEQYYGQAENVLTPASTESAVSGAGPVEWPAGDQELAGKWVSSGDVDW